MMVKYLTDQNGNTTDVVLPIADYIDLLERANELPPYVKAGIETGRQQATQGLTKSTFDVMRKYETKA
ncbi:MAG: hypothetical protein EOP46_07565 [Sphingobacteriaceae bacterium]|nr:MAG: hypothetical protein EOP46_07565 [Sphingobacteriaceae bacterium]